MTRSDLFSQPTPMTDSKTIPGFRDTALRELPLGSVRPSGWLLDQLLLQASGLTGHLEELWADVGSNSAWLGGSGEDWERGPYYLDGLVPLAYLLQDAKLLLKVGCWVDAILESQQPDGQFGPLTNQDWWPRMVALKALMQYHEASNDARVIPFMERYLRFQLATLTLHPLQEWAHYRGADNLLAVHWLYQRTGGIWLLELADLIAKQTFDWGSFLANLKQQDKTTKPGHELHVVNVAMGIKTPALLSLHDPDRQPDLHLDQTLAALAALERHHGQVHGMFSGDEFLAGLAPHQGVELCAVVEFMFTLEQLVQIFGEGRFADQLEQVAYNALPATISAEMRAHQYHQQVNQVLVSVAQRDWTFATDDANLFGLEPNFGCCTANMHQGWPKLARSLWMATAEGGLAAVAYAPCEVKVELAGIGQVQLKVQTHYPFEETIQVTLGLDAPAHFPLKLRIPGWCTTPQVRLNGEALVVFSDAQGFMCIEQEWHDEDVVELVFPMEVRALERPQGRMGLALGPITLALWPGEIWQQIPDSAGFGDWEVRPRRTWNYGLELDPTNPAAACRVERLEVGIPPFAARDAAPPSRVGGVPLRVWVAARRVPDWKLEGNSAALPPSSPTLVWMPPEVVALIPYGCARLRIAEFPQVQAARSTPSEHPRG